MTLKYEGDLDAVTAASEVGMKLEEFQKRIAETESLSRNLGAYELREEPWRGKSGCRLSATLFAI